MALVDRSGRVLSSAPRRVVRRDNLLHAATAVLVRNSAGQIFVHRRSAEKDWAPCHHDAAAGGLVRYGEEPLLAAQRELVEELGVSGPALRPLGLSLYEDESIRCVEHCFETTWDGPVEFADGEVVWGAWLSLADLAERLGDGDWPFVPDTRLLLRRLGRAGVADYALLAG